ncbi:MAG TPA: response regulator [Thermomicrobiales bacterium]|nr:response regulator [Thermomicrobiales bacterium]
MAQRILVVDDSATERQAIVSPLAAEGYQVVAASDGDEALAQLEQAVFDLLVLDVVMPGKNGFQLCRQIRRDDRWSGLPIVMVTSKDQEADRFWGMKQGASEYITKPFGSSELLAAIRKYT